MFFMPDIFLNFMLDLTLYGTHPDLFVWTVFSSYQ
jgi:hypothetical protein